MPNYRCAMGMGLHVGEAVEGAIGTPQKIDATYISLHVNNAEFLESSTKAYKVPLLMSHFFYDRLSPVAKEKCRMLDVVKVTDSLTFQVWTGQARGCNPTTTRGKAKKQKKTLLLPLCATHGVREKAGWT